MESAESKAVSTMVNYAHTKRGAGSRVPTHKTQCLLMRFYLPRAAPAQLHVVLNPESSLQTPQQEYTWCQHKDSWGTEDNQWVHFHSPLGTASLVFHTSFLALRMANDTHMRQTRLESYRGAPVWHSTAQCVGEGCRCLPSCSALHHAHCSTW